MGVVFFPSLPFMGVMVFPSYVLGNVSGEGGTFFVPLSLFSVLLSLPLLSSLSPSPSLSLPFFLIFFPYLILPFFVSSFLPHLFLPLPHKLFPSLFFLLLLFSTSFSFPLFFLKFFFFFEGTACTVYFQDVIDDSTDCN